MARCLSSPAGKLTAVIMGPPGAGKGTISKRIVNKFYLAHLSSGDMLRNHISRQTDVGLEAKNYLDQGKLVPDQVMLNLILTELKQAETGWLLDGFPRTLGQAKALVAETSISTVINLNVPFQTIIDRVKGRWVHVASGRVYNDNYNAPKVHEKDDITGEALVQRADDRPDTVLERLKLYENQTKPVIDFFEEKGLVKTFSGTESDVLWPQVKQYIEKDCITLA